MFEVKSSKKIYHANYIDEIFDYQLNGSYPYVVRSTTNNGVRGYIIQDEKYVNQRHTLSFAQDTFSVFYQKQPYFTGNKVKVLVPKFEENHEKIMKFIVSSFQKKLETFSWGTGSTVAVILDYIIKLPIFENGKINFSFMEKFIAELEATHLAELEAYLSVTGLKDYELTEEEEKALNEFDKVKWCEFNLQELFGKSTRGKRLKSADRIIGSLPFVTAGEYNEGVSDYIKNDVEIFSKNTTTIDMFGSAKYRNYPYGGDDHVAVVHTENLPKYASIFVTTAIHKSSNNGEFSYSRNFYAKDADLLYISLPLNNNMPDYKFMETLISAIQKLVIKDVVLWSDEKLSLTKTVINK